MPDNYDSNGNHNILWGAIMIINCGENNNGL
jgi:hypothetical protein